MTLPKAGPIDVSTCRACGASIVWLKTKVGKNMPVNLLPTEKQFRGPNAGEERYVFGAHQSHFATCPDAGKFRRDK